ncbi:hypothetical protein [Streptomyces sp. NPDC088752]|uniref:hypothetical protein n=1 Tax=Streptomyces sp. NPDC088752 TaxID=3154963 RepID=UPI00344A2001
MSDANTPKIRLTGVGMVDAHEAQTLNVGDKVMWNGGSTSTVTDVEEVSKCFIRVSFTSEDGTPETPRRWKRTARIARIPQTAPQPPAPVEVEPVSYARHTGAHGFGWTRKVSTENPASVRDMITRAQERGDTVTIEDDGRIRLDNAGVVDPGHDGAGERCPVWLAPQRPASIQVEDVEYRMYVGVLRDDVKDMGTVQPANVRQAIKTNAENGHKAERLEDGSIRVYYSWFVPQHPAAEEPTDRPCPTCGVESGQPCKDPLLTLVDETTEGSPAVITGHVIRTGANGVMLSREPWRGGQICGHQTTYGMGAYSERYCGKRKALGEVECAEHVEQTREEYGTVRVAPGNAQGLMLTRSQWGWSVYDGDGGLCASADDRTELESLYGFALLWEPHNGDKPEEPTEEEHAAYAAAMGTEEDINRAARFLPQGEEGTRPCVEVDGAQVYTYWENGTLVVSVDVETVADGVARADGTVPMVITVQGDTVYQA